MPNRMRCMPRATPSPATKSPTPAAATPTTTSTSACLKAPATKTNRRSIAPWACWVRCWDSNRVATGRAFKNSRIISCVPPGPLHSPIATCSPGYVVARMPVCQSTREASPHRFGRQPGPRRTKLRRSPQVRAWVRTSRIKSRHSCSTMFSGPRSAIVLVIP